ncbi:cellulase family glycosylhydrolase [Mucilaginibacter sp. cycad4]|uniref:glycoside hydrolase family 5 protein n=1 Tax=Mucilaginibacter sp. cycad4 TaxID=3342096 RepID=UPI002AAC2EE0|nr:cellulase family glycosylhydrolase [Mucilaginibacter gossypii]WPU98056.1 cellulase family glycosylhydrolase [Mucilaginibacter gossypii]
MRYYGLRQVIDYHYGRLSDNNYLTETPQIIDLWLKLAKKYKSTSYYNLFFEVYNEPSHINPKVWKDAAYNIATATRKVDRQRTLVAGASNYSSIYELSRFERPADDNIIYTFHSYEPFFFTHQGAAGWVARLQPPGYHFHTMRKIFLHLIKKQKIPPAKATTVCNARWQRTIHK